MNSTSLDALKELPWWGAFKIEDGDVHHWQIGSLQFWIEAKPGEWRIHHCPGSDPHSETASHRFSDESPVNMAALHIGVSGRQHDVHVVPILADRDMVARPETPTVVIQHDTTDFFVTTPVFVSVQTPEGTPLIELPSYRPSDSWFGDATEGELCYASRVAAYTDLSRLKHLAGRVATKVSVNNRLPRNLTLERFRLPTPHLSLYVDADSNLWTQDIIITIGNEEPPHIRIDPRPPREATSPRLVVGPRTPAAGNILIRAISRLLR